MAAEAALLQRHLAASAARSGEPQRSLPGDLVRLHSVWSAWCGAGCPPVLPCLALLFPGRLSIKRDRMHVLFGGTKLLQVKG